MQKMKFKIQGMHCKSCATLIGEKIKNQQGVINAKISYDSNKAVVIYDSKKINEAAICRLIETVGDFKAIKIEEKKEEELLDDSNDSEESWDKIQANKEGFFQGASSNKKYFLLGFLVSVSIISFIGFMVMLIKAQASDSLGLGDKKQEFVAQPNYDGQQPTPNDTAPSIQTFNITKDDNIQGNFDAPITLVEFSDFECPFCERHLPTLDKILSEYKDKVRLVYKHFPLGFHPNAQKAAEASECAGEQGKFWEYHDKLFDNIQTGYSLDNFKSWAQELKLNTEKFNVCLDSGKYASKVKADYQEGAAKGVNGTPATFVNGQLVSGAVPYDSFKQIIDNLLNQ